MGIREKHGRRNGVGDLRRVVEDRIADQVEERLGVGVYSSYLSEDGQQVTVKMDRMELERVLNHGR